MNLNWQIVRKQPWPKRNAVGKNGIYTITSLGRYQHVLRGIDFDFLPMMGLPIDGRAFRSLDDAIARAHTLDLQVPVGEMSGT